jgi:hypothetical protein
MTETKLEVNSAGLDANCQAENVQYETNATARA